MLNISQKKEVVERLAKELSKSEISILVNYKGLDVLKMTELRTQLRNEGARIEVVKNSLLVRASEGTDAALMKEFYKGPNAIVYSMSDPVAPAKILSNLQRTTRSLKLKQVLYQANYSIRKRSNNLLNCRPKKNSLASWFIRSMRYQPHLSMFLLVCPERSLTF